jgi:ATP phosphoribosyltransferase
MSEPNSLKLAIQKSGRLHDDSISLLRKCGLKIDNGKDQLKVKVDNFPLELFYLRNSDIPQYLEDGVVDLAIVGENLLIEANTQSKIILPLGFAKCRLSLAIPKEKTFNQLTYFRGKKIATSYPNSLKSFLQKNKIEADIHQISGSVEIAPNIGLADGICDLVSSGNTLFKNGLQEVYSLFDSEAVLAQSSKLDKARLNLIKQLQFRMEAVIQAQNFKYILMNAPNDKINEITQILPVLKSPTVLPLAEEGWSSLHSVIQENQFWEVIDELKRAGAEGILIVPIDKMVL